MRTHPTLVWVIFSLNHHAMMMRSRFALYFTKWWCRTCVSTFGWHQFYTLGVRRRPTWRPGHWVWGWHHQVSVPPYRLVLPVLHSPRTPGRALEPPARTSLPHGESLPFYKYKWYCQKSVENTNSGYSNPFVGSTSDAAAFREKIFFEMRPVLPSLSPSPWI